MNLLPVMNLGVNDGTVGDVLYPGEDNSPWDWIRFSNASRTKRKILKRATNRTALLAG